MRRSNATNVILMLHPQIARPQQHDKRSDHYIVGVVYIVGDHHRLKCAILRNDLGFIEVFGEQYDSRGLSGMISLKEYCSVCAFTE